MVGNEQDSRQLAGSPPTGSKDTTLGVKIHTNTSTIMATPVNWYPCPPNIKGVDVDIEMSYKIFVILPKSGIWN